MKSASSLSMFLGSNSKFIGPHAPKSYSIPNSTHRLPISSSISISSPKPIFSPTRFTRPVLLLAKAKAPSASEDNADEDPVTRYLFKDLSDGSRSVIGRAHDIAKNMGHQACSTGHLLMALLQPGQYGFKVFTEFGLDVKQFTAMATIEVTLDEKPKEFSGGTMSLMRILLDATCLKNLSGTKTTGLHHLFLAVIPHFEEKIVQKIGEANLARMRNYILSRGEEI